MKHFFKFDIMEFVFQKFFYFQEFVFQEFVFQEFVMGPFPTQVDFTCGQLRALPFNNKKFNLNFGNSLQ